MDLSNRDDVEKLVEGCSRGDRKYQHQLYKLLYGKMLGACMRYANDREEAKDFAHDGFIKVFEKIKNFKHTGSLEGWIRRIIVNNTIDHLRKKSRMNLDFENKLVFDQLQDDSDRELEKLKMESLTAEKIIELIHNLSPGYRTVFNLYVVEEYTHKEISEMLNISIGTSKSNLAKAKEKLRDMYIKKYGKNNE